MPGSTRITVEARNRRVRLLGSKRLVGATAPHRILSTAAGLAPRRRQVAARRAEPDRLPGFFVMSAELTRAVFWPSQPKNEGS